MKVICQSPVSAICLRDRIMQTKKIYNFYLNETFPNIYAKNFSTKCKEIWYKKVNIEFIEYFLHNIKELRKRTHK